MTQTLTQTLTTRTLSQLAANPKLPLVAQVAVRFAGLVTQWDKRRQTRCQLKTLDLHILEDIGISQAQARKEAARPFWLA
jgi:uncharacterized protein YjiS (DUF1127 family)